MARTKTFVSIKGKRKGSKETADARKQGGECVFISTDILAGRGFCDVILKRAISISDPGQRAAAAALHVAHWLDRLQESTL